MNIDQILTSKFITHIGNNDTYIVGRTFKFPRFDSGEELYVCYASLTKDKSTLYFRKTDDFKKFVHAEFNMSDFEEPKFSIDLDDFDTFKLRCGDGSWTEVDKSALEIL